MLYLAITGIIITFFAAVGAKSLSEFSRHELEEICQRRKSERRLSQILARHEQLMLAAETLQVIGTAVALVGILLWLQSHLTDGTSTSTNIGLAIVSAIIPLLLAEIWLPWAIARLWAAPFVYFTWSIWCAVGFAMAPIVLGARFVNSLAFRLAGRPMKEPDEESFEDEIRTIMTEGHRGGLLEEDAREMIEGVIELGDVVVSEIMTPRTDMVGMPLALTWQEMIEFITRLGHSRIPVYDKDRDDIVGVLVTKDLLAELARDDEHREISWTKLLRDPCFVPETKPVDVLLQEFQATRNHMVIVLDEYGGVAGLVTMEDVLEEIVGEIADEHDNDTGQDITEIDENTIEAMGRVHIDEINERLDIELPEDKDYDTIGGFVFSELGHIPSIGEQVLWNDEVRVTVTDATRRRVDQVQIERF